jgi:PPM family protein phosphatase
MTSGSDQMIEASDTAIEPQLLEDGHIDLGVLGIAAWVTDVGHIRERNEDRLFVRLLWGGTHLMLMVADGAGGHERGDQAAEQVVLTFSECSSGEGSPPEEGAVAWLIETISEAHQRVLALSKGGGRPPASTVVGLLIETASLCAWRFHVGDSRVYSREPAGMVAQLTRDHNIANGLIDCGLAVSQAMKVAEGARLTQVLGGGVDQEPEVHGPLQLLPGQCVLIASDGVFGHNGGREVLLPAMKPGDLSLLERAIRLKRAVLQGEAPDNLTAVLWEVPEGLVATVARDTVTNSMKSISDDEITRRVGIQKAEAPEDDEEEEEEPSLFSSAGLVAFLLLLAVALSVVRLHGASELFSGTVSVDDVVETAPLESPPSDMELPGELEEAPRLEEIELPGEAETESED